MLLQEPMLKERATGFIKSQWMKQEPMVVAWANGQSKSQWLQQQSGSLINRDPTFRFLVRSLVVIKMKLPAVSKMHVVVGNGCLSLQT